jgi:hypothetical protein
MSKIITDELIEQLLDKRGFPEDASEESMLCAVQDYYDTELVDRWPNYADYWVYTESTRDGYEVFVATHNPDRISINEDVHYYENDLAGELEDAIADGGKIYVDDLDAYYVTEAVLQNYEYLRDRLTEEIEDELINDGYVREEETETA